MSKQQITYEGVTYKVGDRVVATDSLYEGFTGTILDIIDVDEEYRETENETPDIYVDFDIPEAEEKRKEYEAVFSWLYGEPRSIIECALDCVIMAPEMLEHLEGGETHV